MHLFPEPAAFSAYMVTVFLVGIAPGPGMFYAVARGLTNSAWVTGLAVLGLATASFTHSSDGGDGAGGAVVSLSCRFRRRALCR